MRDLAGLSWDMVAIAWTALVPVLLLLAIAQALKIRSLRQQLAEADDEIDDLRSAQEAGGVTFLKVHHHG